MNIKKDTLQKDTTATTGHTRLFDNQNMLWMLAGLAVMIIGFLLMAGGRSEDPKVFNADEVYSTTRITIAPILIIAGLVIEVFAIFRHPKNQ